MKNHSTDTPLLQGMNVSLRVPRLAVGVSPTRSPIAPPRFCWVPVLLAVSLLGGCASHEPASPAHAPDAAALLRRSGSSAITFENRLGLAVAAADLAANAAEKTGANSDRALYNQACAAVAVLSRKVSLPATLATPSGTYRLESDSTRSAGCWNPSDFSDLIPTTDIKNQSLVARQPLAGFGGALVGVRHVSNPRAFFLPRVGVSSPVTAVVNIKPSAVRGALRHATLSLYNPSKITSARIAGAIRPLAADLSAPFGYYPNPPNLGILGMFNPLKYMEEEGLFLAQPYDPSKIPLVLIHGLMSVPQMWLPVMADIASDPVLREKYQLWVFAYPTGNPIGYSALELREALEGVYKVYPGTRPMVIVNHSLGGVISHLQVISSGDSLVKALFPKNAPEILSLPDSALLKRGLVFEANPNIARVVFVAAPHRGAPLAINPAAAAIASVIRVPGTLVRNIGQQSLQLAASAAGMNPHFIPNGINALSPKNPLLVAMNTVPIKVPYHSIIGVAGAPKSPLEKTSDTVVPYWSSHLDGALSQKIVPYPHTAMFVKPKATDEIKRILKLHLGTSG